VALGRRIIIIILTIFVLSLVVCSGSKIMQEKMMRYGDEHVKNVGKEWSEKIKRGKLSSPAYLQQKWGCRNEEKVRNHCIQSRNTVA
jgi:hypothetical protein